MKAAFRSSPFRIRFRFIDWAAAMRDFCTGSEFLTIFAFYSLTKLLLLCEHGIVLIITRNFIGIVEVKSASYPA